MVSALDSGASAPGSSPGRGLFVVFLVLNSIWGHAGQFSYNICLIRKELLTKQSLYIANVETKGFVKHKKGLSNTTRYTSTHPHKELSYVDVKGRENNLFSL